MSLAIFDPSNNDFDDREPDDTYFNEVGLTAEQVFEKQMIQRLARLLLNPVLDRGDIADGILADQELIQFLCKCQKIIVEKTIPAGTAWEDIEKDLEEVGTFMIQSARPRRVFVMPVLLGCLYDENDKLWFQSSPFEFLPAIEGIKTSNMYGKPTFDAALGTTPARECPNDLPKVTDLCYP
ncbi:hypothetical protein SH528x_003294 [Novipirellula sp. SH528]|uniref:hypothetical protein n=1 Tax=Novipirellula sp. SH528 TaxID=3454466 RepID=UPI003FA05D40